MRLIFFVFLSFTFALTLNKKMANCSAPHLFYLSFFHFCFLPNEIISFRRKKLKFIRNTKNSWGGPLQTGLNASWPKKFKSQTSYLRVLGIQSSWAFWIWPIICFNTQHENAQITLRLLFFVFLSFFYFCFKYLEKWANCSASPLFSVLLFFFCFNT